MGPTHTHIFNELIGQCIAETSGDEKTRLENLVKNSMTPWRDFGEVNICSISKMFDAKFKRIELRIEPDVTEEDPSMRDKVAAFMSLIIRIIHKQGGKPLAGQAPAGQMEGQLQTMVDDMGDK